MSEFNDGLLRMVLRVDAVASAAIGVSGAVAAATVDDRLGIPAGWLVAFGVVTAIWCVALLWLASRPRMPAAGVWAVIALNLVIAAASLLVLFADWWPLTTVGATLVITQAVGVVVLAELEYVGLRRSRATALRTA